MKVPYPDTVEVSDYEIGRALMEETLQKHSPGLDTILVTAAPLGYHLYIAPAFKSLYHDDAVLAEAANILMARAMEASLKPV